jgi:hypothetical protein
MARDLEAVLDEANPNKLPTAAQVVRLGSGMGQIVAFREGAVALDVMQLPDTAKCALPLRVFRRTGGATGYCTVVAPETVPAAGQVSVTAVGDLLFAAADAVTAAEAYYEPVEGEFFEDEVTVGAGSIATLAQARRGVLLREAEVLVGVIPGVKLVVGRGTAPAAGQAALSAAGGTVAFNAADAVAGDRVRLRYIATPGVGNGPAASLSGRLDSDVEF